MGLRQAVKIIDLHRTVCRQASEIHRLEDRLADSILWTGALAEENAARGRTIHRLNNALRRRKCQARTLHNLWKQHGPLGVRWAGVPKLPPQVPVGSETLLRIPPPLEPAMLTDDEIFKTGGTE